MVSHHWRNLFCHLCAAVLAYASGDTSYEPTAQHLKMKSLGFRLGFQPRMVPVLLMTEIRWENLLRLVVYPIICRVLAPSNRGGWPWDFWLPSTGVETWDNWFYGISPWKTTIWGIAWIFSYHLLFKSKWEEWKAIIGLPSLRVYCSNLPDFWSSFCD